MNLEKIQRGLFYLLIVLLPVQLGKHFWPEFAFISGVRVDYLSPTMYLTDILIFGIFGIQILLGIKQSHRNLTIFLLVLIFATVNAYLSLSPLASIYKWLKVLEVGFLVWWVAKSEIKIRTVCQLMLIPIFFQALLVVWQFMIQGSTDLFWIFGERNFNSTTPGIANTIINSQLVLRPYGSFSHPNVLGGWLAVVLPLVIYYFPHNYRRFAAASVAFGFCALILSMSRAAIGVGLVATGGVLALKHRGKLVFFLGAASVVGVLSLLRGEVEPIEVRGQLNSLAVKSFYQSPFVGSGLGTAPSYKGERITNYALANQPTHNIYLLTLGESGVIGLASLLGIMSVALVRAGKVSNWGVVTSLLSIGTLGLVDHYFLTLQQTQLLFAIVLGLGLKLDDGS